VAKQNKRNRAVFLDRDGTIIAERNYLRRVKDVKLLKGSVEAMKLLKALGYKLIIVTNQSGIGRGYLTENKLAQIHKYLLKLLKSKGVKIDGIYYCPHHPDEKCACRKPNTELVKLARDRFNLDLKKSFTVGDHTGDFRLGRNMGGKGIFVKSGHWKHEQKKIDASGGAVRPDYTAANILAAAKLIERVS